MVTSSGDKSKYRRGSVIKDPNGNKKLHNILGINMSKSKCGNCYKTSVLVREKDSNSSILYSRACVNCHKELICYSDLNNSSVKHILSTCKGKKNDRFMYLKKEIEADETADLKAELENLYSQLVIDENVFDNFFMELETEMSFVGVVN